MSPPQVIASRFEIADPARDLLGRGGMGEVYRGTDLQTGQPVAIKVLLPAIVAQRPELVARFAREGEALRQLDHPNIVKMIAAISQDSQNYLVMEYVPGGSLRDLLAVGALPVRRALEIALDLADALTRAHRLGIVHRDIKPANVLLASDGTPRLTDFGVAHVTSDVPLTQAGLVVGTAEYLSPEACREEALDPRADIWAFGVLLYEMLTNQRPFAGNTLVALLNAILTQPTPDLVQLRPGLPDALVDLVYRMLEKDRDQRIPTVRLVGVELETILREQAGLSTGSRPAGGRFATPPSSQAAAHRHNLPLQPTPFVGREVELGEIARLLADPAVRLLTILGLGGMGKTRLALAAGLAQLERFADGVYLVPLAPLGASEAIVPAIAEAIGFTFYEGTEHRRQLLDYLRAKSMLLLPDNCEHLLDGAALIAEILQVAPQVKVLATSRARLNLQAEQLFHLGGMDFPDWETPEDAARYSAVQLFVQSARRVRPAFELAAADLQYISRICRLVQGVPLGIILAAAWVEMLSPQEIAAEMGQGLDFLAADIQDLPERQRSLRAVFDYSWNLLSGREKELFRALSVFRGGFTREAAQEVAGAGLRELMTLVNKSLLHRLPTGRYEMHELLRHYAAEKLAADPAAEQAYRDRHCAYFAAELERWDQDQRGPRQKETLARLEPEAENVRTAWDWAVERRDIPRLAQAIAGLGTFYGRRNRNEEGAAAFHAAAEALATEAAPAGLRLRAVALNLQSGFALTLGHGEQGEQLARQALETLGQAAQAGQDVRRERILILWTVAAPQFVSRPEETRPLFEEALALTQAVGDRWLEAIAEGALGDLAWHLGRTEEMKRRHEADLAIRRALGDSWGIANALSRLALVAIGSEQFEEGERLERESVAIYRELGDQARLAEALGDLGATLVWLGKNDEARAAVEESLALLEHLGDRMRTTHYNIVLGRILLHQGHYEQARAQAEMGLAMAREHGYLRQAGISLQILGSAALTTGDNAAARTLAQESVALYQQLGHHEELASALAILVAADMRLGDIEQAQQSLSAVMHAVAGLQSFKALLMALAAAALFLAGRGEPARALEVYAALRRYPAVANSRWFADILGRPLAEAAATLPATAVAAAEERGRARDLESVRGELQEWLERLVARLG